MHLTELELRGGFFWLRFTDSTDFRAALEAFKRAVPFPDRTWLEGQSLWRVTATAANEARLSSLFPDFARKLDLIRRQLLLFEEDD